LDAAVSAESRPSYTVMARRLGVNRTTARRRMLAAGDVEAALPSIGADGRRHPGRVSRELAEARNRRIVELKAAGWLNKQIAVEVNCCVDTVRKVLVAHRRGHCLHPETALLPG
jgi:DNA-binding NarL/FixJ family response regulator